MTQKEYCKCGWKELNEDFNNFVSCVQGNTGDCNKCGKPVHPKTIIKVFGSSQKGRMVEVTDDFGEKTKVWKND